MLMSSRTIFSDNGTLIDLSTDLANFKSGTAVLPIIATEDYLYIGADLPFNHRYIDVTTSNDETAAITVEVWDGQAWKVCEDVIDQTSIAGATLAQSGIISWVPSDTTTWARWDTNNQGEQIIGLTGVKIRNLYWARLSFDNDLDSMTEIEYIGHKFSDDEDLEVLYPDLTRAAVIAQFQAGKTNWKIQHIQAAEEIIKDLIKQQIVVGSGQVLKWELFRDMAVHKVAEIAFNGFGKDFKDNKDDAIGSYKKEMNKGIFAVDLNNNAVLDVAERTWQQGWLKR